jgi:hypothetical protein
MPSVARRPDDRRAMHALRLTASVVAFAVGVASATSMNGQQPRQAIKPAVQARARAISLRAADLPGPHWDTATAAAPPDAIRCSFYKPDQADLTVNGRADSPTFHRADGSDVASSVSVYASAAQARTAFRRVAQPAFPRCLADIFGSGAGTTKVAAGPLPFPRFGDRSAAFRVSLVVTSFGRKVPVVLDIVIVNRGRVVTAVYFDGVGSAFPASFEKHVIGRIAARMA